MSLEEIIKTYGNKSDYYDMPSGKIFRISEMHYDKEKDISYIPIWDSDLEGGFIFSGYGELKGDYTK